MTSKETEEDQINIFHTNLRIKLRKYNLVFFHCYTKNNKQNTNPIISREHLHLTYVITLKDFVLSLIEVKKNLFIIILI